MEQLPAEHESWGSHGGTDFDDPVVRDRLRRWMSVDPRNRYFWAVGAAEGYAWAAKVRGESAGTSEVVVAGAGPASGGASGTDVTGATASGMAGAGVDVGGVDDTEVPDGGAGAGDAAGHGDAGAVAGQLPAEHESWGSWDGTDFDDPAVRERLRRWMSVAEWNRYFWSTGAAEGYAWAAKVRAGTNG